MSTAIPGRHIEGMVRAFSHHGVESPPEGWASAKAYRDYLDDADGGRHPLRYAMHRPPDSTPTFFEIASREA